MKILVVDDEAYIRQLLSYNLKLDGHDVILAENGLNALEKVKEKPELILLDVMMPEMDGLETCAKLKGNPDTREIPIFMLTAKSQMRDIEDAFKIGADDYLTKPFDPLDLNNRILSKINAFRKSRSK